MKNTKGDGAALTIGSVVPITNNAANIGEAYASYANIVWPQMTQKIVYPTCGCELSGIAPLPIDCPTHGAQISAKTEKGKISVAIILDESSSMGNCKRETISGYNEYIERLNADGNEYLVTLSKFDAFEPDPTCRVIYKETPVDKVPRLDALTYTPRGSTPLYDAVGITVVAMGDGPEDKLVIILTDGEENASKEWKAQAVKDLIKDREKTGKWTFVFLGANQDAWATGAAMGMHSGNTQSYSVGNTQQVFSNLASATAMRSFNSIGGQSATMNYFADAGVEDVNAWIQPNVITNAASVLGSAGGTKRASNLTPQQLSDIAKKASNSRKNIKK